MSHGDRIDRLPAGFRSLPTAKTRRSRPPATTPACTASSSPRGRPHAPGRGDTPQLHLQSVRRVGVMDAGQLRCRGHREDSAAGRRRQGHLRAFWGSTRRSRRSSCTRPWAASSPASSSTTACCGREEPERVRDVFQRSLALNLIYVDAASASSPRLRASPTPNGSARSSAPSSSTCSRNRPRPSGRSISSRRGLSTPTSSRARPREHCGAQD